VAMRILRFRPDRAWDTFRPVVEPVAAS
jgi:hypothetical protein